MRELRVAPGLALPVDIVGESTAILAKKGAGKSNTAKVLVEEALDHGGVQVVVLDPIGHWWSLRADASGKPKGGYPVAVFGGMHGDLPLEETSGRLIAQTAVETGQSMVLDVSGLDSNGAMQRFVFDLLEELYKLKQKTPSPLLLVLEEADEFAPQDPKGTNVPRMVGAANRISKRGRGRGIGMLYVTQRSAALNKNVLDQSDTLIVMRTVGPRDRAAIEGWVKYQDADGMQAVLPSLPSLVTGEAWVWTPERGLLKRVKIRKARTFDTSKTPRPGDAELVVDVKPIDVEALGERMRETAERAKANDPRLLQQRVRHLERELSDRPEQIETREVEVRVPIEVSVLSAEDIAKVEEQVAEAREIAAQIEGLPSALRAMAEQVSAGLARVASSRHLVEQGERREVAVRREPAGVPPARRPAQSDVEGLTAPQVKVLGALAWLESIGIDQPDKLQVGFASGYSPNSGNFGNLLGQLRAAGLVHYPAPRLVALTEEGRAYAPPVDRPESDDELRRSVLDRLTGPQARLLAVLIEKWPDQVTRTDLGDLTGYSSTSGNFGNLLGQMRTLGVIEYPQQGSVVASDLLFPGVHV